MASIRRFIEGRLRLKVNEEKSSVTTPEKAHCLGFRFRSHLRRRLRAIIVKHKKRSRHLYRHLRACGVERGAAIRCAYRTGGIWPRSISNAMHRAYPNAWREERVYTLWTEWRRQHPEPVVALDGQLLLGLEIAT